MIERFLYKIAIEHTEPGARRNSVAEEGVPMNDIAESIGVP